MVRELNGGVGVGVGGGGGVSIYSRVQTIIGAFGEMPTLLPQVCLQI